MAEETDLSLERSRPELIVEHERLASECIAE